MGSRLVFFIPLVFTPRDAALAVALNGFNRSRNAAAHRRARLAGVLPKAFRFWTMAPQSPERAQAPESSTLHGVYRYRRLVAGRPAWYAFNRDGELAGFRIVTEGTTEAAVVHDLAARVYAAPAAGWTISSDGGADRPVVSAHPRRRPARAPRAQPAGHILQLPLR